MSVEQYRWFADECMGWAKAAATDDERIVFLQMAIDWLQVATMTHLQPFQTETKQADQFH